MSPLMYTLNHIKTAHNVTNYFRHRLATYQNQMQFERVKILKRILPKQFLWSFLVVPKLTAILPADYRGIATEFLCRGNSDNLKGFSEFVRSIIALLRNKIATYQTCKKKLNTAIIFSASYILNLALVKQR